MWSQPDTSMPRSGVGKLFIKNLDKDITNKGIYDTFSVFGKILSCNVATDDKGISQGYGFVYFDTEQAAQNAIENANGMLLNGKKIHVSPFLSLEDRKKENYNKTKLFTNVYVKNIPEDLNDQKLEEMFEPFGKITSCKVMTTEDGKSRCFGFVNFETTKEAEAAVETLNGKEIIAGKPLYLARAQKKAERQQDLRESRKKSQYSEVGCNLYVKNLDKNVDDEALRQYFSLYGTISSAKVMVNKEGESKGYGFVCFVVPSEANIAVAELNGRPFHTQPLYVNFAKSKDERKSQKTAEYMRHLNGNSSQSIAPAFPHFNRNERSFMPTIPAGNYYCPPRVSSTLNNIHLDPNVPNSVCVAPGAFLLSAGGSQQNAINHKYNSNYPAEHSVSTTNQMHPNGTSQEHLASVFSNFKFF